MSQRARILPVRQKTNCKTQTTIFAKSTVSGLQVPSPSGTRVAKTPHIACRDSFRKPGPSYPALFFPCAPARNRFALCRRSLLPKAFAPAATWTRLCSRSSRTGGWLHSRYRETSASPYQKEGDSAAALGTSHLPFGWSFWKAVAWLALVCHGAGRFAALQNRLLSYRASRNYLWCWGGYAASHNYPLSHARGQSLPDSARRRVRALY